MLGIPASPAIDQTALANASRVSLAFGVQTRRIILIDSDATQRVRIEFGLASAGCSVDTYADYDVGLRHALIGIHDLILIASSVGGRDALSALERLRAAGNDGLVLWLSGGGIEERVDGLNRGAYDCLVRPFAFPELLARIRALVRTRARASRSSFAVGDLEIDHAGRALRRDGNETRLTPCEFLLLERLIRHVGIAVPRAELIEALRNPASGGDAGSLNVLVCRLRRKIAMIGAGLRIQAMRGYGYAIVDPDADR